MRVAVLSLTRDRLDYTKHCFARLRELAGCEYDHYVLDQGSRDGTVGWLVENRSRFARVELVPDNIGISRGMNVLVGAAPGYDVYVKFDNDCELTVQGTLQVACDLARRRGNLIVSPQIKGLNQPPNVEEEFVVDDVRLGRVGQIGGIFMAVPGWVFFEYRYDDGNPTWGMDDVGLSRWFRDRDGTLAYLLDYPANHYETTETQKITYPAYWERKKREMGLD